MSNLVVKDKKYNQEVDGIFEEDFEKKYFQTKFKWDDFQIHSFLAIKNNDNLLVCAPTSSGKTSVAKYATIYNLIKREGIVIYTTPIKSLSNEKYEEMKELLNPLGYEVGLITGDQKINLDANFIIMTAEILSNALFLKEIENEKSYYDLDLNIIDKINCVIMDEIHFISDDSRGHIWENTIILLKDKVQIVGLSATIDDPENFASWIGNIKNKQITLVKKYDRPIPIEYSFFDGDELNIIMDENGKYYGDEFSKSIQNYKSYQNLLIKDKKNFISNYLNSFITYSIKNNLFQLAFIVFSKKNCEKLAEMVQINLNTIKESRHVIKQLELLLGHHYKIYRDLPRYKQVVNLIEKGICFHHAGLPVILKEAIEKLYKNNLIKILFATETIAVGVNMPIRTIVFTSLEKKSNVVRLLNGAEFKQIAGRAGRRGLDTKGNVVIAPLYNIINQTLIQNELLFGKNPRINSKLELNYHNYLKIIQNDNINHQNYYKKSLLGNQNIKICQNMKEKIDILNNEYKKLHDNILKEDINHNIYVEYYKLKDVVQSGYSLNRKQKKREQFLEKEMDKKYLDKYEELNEKKSKIMDIEKNINYLDVYSSKEYEKIINFLIEGEYLRDKDTITNYGIMASNINECNPFILVEIFIGNIIEQLNVKQIIILMSIFCNYKSDIKLKDLVIDDILVDVGYYLKDRIRFYHNTEKKFNINPSDYFNITFDYMNITKLWLDLDLEKEDYSKILGELKIMDEYEGSFIKNMLKINNIINNLISLCKINKNYNYLPKLEEAEGLLLKGFVNADSLHVS